MVQQSMTLIYNGIVFNNKSADTLNNLDQSLGYYAESKKSVSESYILMIPFI